MLSLIYENVELFFSSVVDEHFDIAVPFISLTVSFIIKSGMGWDFFFSVWMDRLFDPSKSFIGL